MLNWDFAKLSTGKYETNEYEISEVFGAVSVDTDTADIKLVHSEKSTASVVCYEQKKVKHNVKVEDGTLVAFMRENSGKGLPCFKSISRDHGTTWEGVYETNIYCCHRPVVGKCETGNYFMTYRFMQGGKGWLGCVYQNLFGAFFTKESSSGCRPRGP